MNRETALRYLFDIYYRHAKEIKYVCDKLCVTGENGVLIRLSINGGQMSSGELADSMDLTSGRIANILKSLEKKDLIFREKASGDKRYVIAGLTDKGRDKIRKIDEENKELVMSFIDEVDLDDMWKSLEFLEDTICKLEEKHAHMDSCADAGME